MRAIFILMVALFPCSLAAQTALVQSGEHANFTRLAVLAPGMTDWTIETTEAGPVLRISPARTTFDVSKVFERVPRTRLRQIQAPEGGGMLLLKLGCDCRVSAFEFRPGILVVDINDQSGTNDTKLPDVDPAKVFQAYSEPAPAPSQLPRRAPGRGVSVSLPDQLREGLATERLRSSIDLTALGVEATIDPSEVTALQSRLVHSLSTSIARGILKPDLKLDATERSHVGGSEPMLDLVQQSLAPVPVIVSRLDQHSLSSEDCSALFSDVFDPDVTTKETLQSLKGLRAKLFSELDRLDQYAFDMLISAYLRLGLGTEAYGLLTERPERDQRLDYLALIAVALDDLDGKTLTELAEADCPEFAFWKSLVFKHGTQPSKDVSQSLLKVFQNLPPNIQSQIGARLLQTNAGNDPVFRAQVSSALSLDDGRGKAPIMQREQEPESHLIAGDQFSRQVAQVSQDLMTVGGSLRVRERDALIAANSKTDPDVLLMSSFQNELSGTPIDDVLQGSIALAFAKSGDFRRALEDPDRIDRETLNAVFQLMVSVGSNDAFLWGVSSLEDQTMDRLDPESKTMAHQRLLRLDLPELAELYPPDDDQASGLPAAAFSSPDPIGANDAALMSAVSADVSVADLRTETTGPSNAIATEDTTAPKSSPSEAPLGRARGLLDAADGLLATGLLN